MNKDDKEFTPEQYEKLIKDFDKILQLGTPSTSITNLLKWATEKTKNAE